MSYLHASAGVVVTLLAGGAGNAFGDGSVGFDTFTGGVNRVRGTLFDDTIYGSNNPANTTTETFEGRGGNDFIDGGGGFDRASYALERSSIAVNLATGVVTGGSSGTDTLRSVESIVGTDYNDAFDATGYGLAGALNVGNNGTFNQFEGLPATTRSPATATPGFHSAARPGE